MDAHPPTYETATLVDVWDLVARYLLSRDLCSAALVCSRWHATFVPHIWGNPASHFGIENDAVYVALTRFKRTLHTARLFLRSLTHTLHLPPAHAEIYNGPQADWLREMLERLPNLQSLIVRGLPFFDYATLQSLRITRSKPEGPFRLPSDSVELSGSTVSFDGHPAQPTPSFGLRLLDASRCPNVTPSSLAAALRRFDALMYLDLSFSYPARNEEVLCTLQHFAGLQVLKLQGLGLKDESVHVLSKSIGMRVRSLDVRDNRLTDRAIRTLLDYCFLREENGIEARLLSSGPGSPTLLPYIGAEMLGIYQGEEFEGFLRNAFTGRFVSRLAIEDVTYSGITHLYLSGNPVTVEGISGLIRSERLHVLDVGTVAGMVASLPSMSAEAGQDSVTMPSMEKLTPLLTKYATESISFLRIDHTMLTKQAPNLTVGEVVQGRVELADSSLAYNSNTISELDGRCIQPEGVELSADPQTPRCELEGDPMHFMLSSATDQTFHVEIPADAPREARRGSALAPEVVAGLTASAQVIVSPSPLPVTEDSTISGARRGRVLHMNATSSATLAASPHPQRPRTYSSMGLDRQARIDRHLASGGSLHPAMLPHVRTLVLTEVPPFSPNKDVANRIINFIKQCAQEASLANEQALLDYAAPPGRRGQASILRGSANKIFALKRLVLEIAPEQHVLRNIKGSQWAHSSLRSVTEDRDSEALWSASEADFSFFGNEECVFPTLDTGRFAFYSGIAEKEVNFNIPKQDAGKSKVPALAKIDNIALISAFRKDRKAAHHRQKAALHHSAETEGFWDGVVQVVRSNPGMRHEEQEDYYGNRFTNNYLYR